MSDSDEPKVKTAAPTPTMPQNLPNQPKAPPPRPTPNVMVEGGGDSKWDRAFMVLVAVFIGQVVVFFTIIMWVGAWRFLVAGGCPQW